jgi:hypothetical protein
MNNPVEEKALKASAAPAGITGKLRNFTTYTDHC